MISKALVGLMLAMPVAAFGQGETVGGWQMQDVAKVSAAAEVVSSAKFAPEGWYKATVPGTVLTTLVDNKVYPEPLYGENMRAIPESLNKTSYWYRAEFAVPASNKGKLTWVHFEGINYSADVWVNGQKVGSIRGAFIRGDFDVTAYVKPGRRRRWRCWWLRSRTRGFRSSTTSRTVRVEGMAGSRRSTGRRSCRRLDGTGCRR